MYKLYNHHHFHSKLQKETGKLRQEQCKLCKLCELCTKTMSPKAEANRKKPVHMSNIPTLLSVLPVI